LPLALLTQAIAAQAPAKQGTRQVTFTKDVAPILQRSCQNCHRPDSMAPMSFLTYEDVRPWARAIKQKVAAREMPPWFIDRTVGDLEVQTIRSLSEQEIETLAAWADAGAVRGNPGRSAPPRQFREFRYLAHREAGSRDQVGSAHSALDRFGFGGATTSSKPGLTEDRYLKAVETKPAAGAKKVVHHAVHVPAAGRRRTGPHRRGPTQGAGAGGDAGGFLNEYAVGKNGDVFPEGTGRLGEAGAKIRFQHALSPGR